jgi:hypothetical protein
MNRKMATMLILLLLMATFQNAEAGWAKAICLVACTIGYAVHGSTTQYGNCMRDCVASA